MAQREWLCPRRVAGAREGTGAIHTLRVDVSQRNLPTQVTTKAAGILRSCMKARKERSKSSPGNRRITWTWHPCARLVASTISRPPSSFPAGGAALFIPPAPDTLSGFDFVCDIVWRSPPSALRAAPRILCTSSGRSSRAARGEQKRSRLRSRRRRTPGGSQPNAVSAMAGVTTDTPE